jgi:NAD(P)-dependent dehydrogenase (short-subunit alcohol dehydrogenase family)
MSRLRDKTIIVTGGSGLLGKAIVEQLSNDGARVINFEVKESTDLSKGLVQCDVTKPEAIAQGIELVRKEFGHIHGLVNNAYPRTADWGEPFDTISPESWRTNIDWQMNSYAFMMQQVIPLMKSAGGGSIVNMASIYGVVGNDFTLYEGTAIRTVPAYTAIKGGLINLTRYLASAYGAYNIRVNCVSPGGIFDHQDPKFVQAYEHKVPMKRMGKPEDIAPPVSFLLSEEAQYITGQNLIVDGGWTAI